MKKYIFLILAIAFLYACSEESLQEYSSGNFLNFKYKEYKNFENDSLDVSFFFYPGKQQIKIPLEIELVGKLLKENKEYSIEFDKEKSTAEESDFTLPENAIFRANRTLDTLLVTLNKSAKLENEKFKLVLNLVSNKNFTTGITEKKSFKIYFTSMVSKPTWWKDEIESVYLGEFSALKYNLFFKVNNISDLTDIHLSVVRQYALKLKRYLFEHPTHDDNGNLIEVPVMG